jgi:hypothetical protein
MFARAFQGIMYEQLKELNIRNEMLTASGEYERSDFSTMFIGLTQEERERVYEWARQELLPYIQSAVLEQEGLAVKPVSVVKGS